MESQLKVELLQITPNAEEFIGRCASICYDSSTEQAACVKRAAACVEKGHLATLRFAHATFNVSGISRACSHQFVRSKHLDFLQQSQRYVKVHDNPHVTPPSLAGRKDVENFMQDAKMFYLNLLKSGIKKEDARFVLPEATCTELNVTGNFQAWLDFINLRSGKHAQWEIREVAQEINRILMKECPNIFLGLNE
jgi:thymidylate synthase (FAD)